MIGWYAATAGALLTASMAQAPRPATPPCCPPQARIADSTSRWLCGQLAAAGKSHLEGATAYRFVYLASFRPAKIVEVRQERSGWLIQTTILSGIGGGPPGAIRERRQRWLTADDVMNLEATVNRSGVWRPDVRVDSKVVDDSTLVVEAVRPGTHRVHVIAATARDQLPLNDFCELLRAMAGIDDLEK
jgi:hypothetical protein